MKIKYLQAMGVVSWRLRDKDPAPTLSTTLYYRLLAADGKSQGLLIATLNPEQWQREQQLLVAIIQALGMASEQVPAANAERAIALGAHPATVNTHSLAEMLKNPALKSPVWKALQDFFRP